MSQRIGYARVSTDDQHLDLPRTALGEVRCGVIYEETATGKGIARSAFEQCRKAAACARGRAGGRKPKLDL